MKKYNLITVILIIALFSGACDRSIKEKIEADESLPVSEKMQWWDEARFGMFIHFGVYSDLGGVWKGEPVEGYAEHIMRIAQIPRDGTYHRGIDDARNSAKLMPYIVGDTRV